MVLDELKVKAVNKFCSIFNAENKTTGCNLHINEVCFYDVAHIELSGRSLLIFNMNNELIGNVSCRSIISMCYLNSINDVVELTDIEF